MAFESITILFYFFNYGVVRVLKIGTSFLEVFWLLCKHCLYVCMLKFIWFLRVLPCLGFFNNWHVL